MPDQSLDQLRDAIHSSLPAAAVEALLQQRPELIRMIAESGTGLLADTLRAWPAFVHAKEDRDGGTPLHFARDIPTAQLLLEHGANIDARDDDHASTPAQWLIGTAPDVSRYLLDRGAAPDIFLAAALGDLDLAAKLIVKNPSCVAHRIGRRPDFPPTGHHGLGGTILQWTLGFNSYAHQIALRKGHPDLFDFLYQNSDTPTRFLVCCVLARREQAEAIAREHPGIVANLPAQDLELMPIYCWETNMNYEAVRLMLDLGFPIAKIEFAHGYSALHNAAWSGNAELVDLLISRGHPVDLVDPRYQATPLGYAIHDCIVEKRHPEGNFAQVVESLLKAGSPWDRKIYPTGDESIDAVLKTF